MYILKYFVYDWKKLLVGELDKKKTKLTSLQQTVFFNDLLFIFEMLTMGNCVWFLKFRLL